MCGAFETSPPSGPKRAQEKSRRSFIFVDIAVLCKILPKISCDGIYKKLLHIFLPSHLFSYAHKAVGENSQLNRVKFLSNFPLSSRANLDPQISIGSHLGNAAWLDKNCAETVYYYGWTIYCVTLAKVLQQ